MIPPRLKKANKIGVVAPSNFKKKEYDEYINGGMKILEQWGFELVIGKSLDSIDKYGISAGSAQIRAKDINSMFGDPKIGLIWCAWGGDTANELLELLNYKLVGKNPKIFMGLSDNTVLINALYQKAHLVTFHGTDLRVGEGEECLGSSYTQKEFKLRFIEGKIGDINKDSDWKTVRKGRGKGRIIGGNLSSILKLAGTPYFSDPNEAILLLEGGHTTIKDAIYKLTQLRDVGVFEKISGVVVGFMLSFDREEQFDREGKRVLFEDIVLDLTKDYSFPILKINEFGHRCPSTFLPIGGMGEMDAGKKIFRIIEKCVS